jgi:tRNA(fMet)-specific endonuclease VapC
MPRSSPACNGRRNRRKRDCPGGACRRFIKGGRRRRNQEELNRFLSLPRVNVVDVTEETAERYGIILNSLWKAGTPIPTNDIWIAASAMEQGLQILTTDAQYQKVGQVMVEHFPS